MAYLRAGLLAFEKELDTALPPEHAEAAPNTRPEPGAALPEPPVAANAGKTRAE